MNGEKRDDLASALRRRIHSRIDRKRLVLFSILSIPTLLALVFVPVQGEAATTSLEAILAQGAPNANQLCSSSGNTPIGTFTLSSKECQSSGSTQSGSGTGSFTGQAMVQTTYSTSSKLVLAVLAQSEATVSADFQGIYDYNSKATDTFSDTITIMGGTSGQQGMLEVCLNVVGAITVTGNGAADSASLTITVSSPLGSDDMEYISPMTINGPMVFKVPFNFDISGEFTILVEAFAGQTVNGPFSATQTVNLDQPPPPNPSPLTVTLDWVRVENFPNGDVISGMGFEYPSPPDLTSPPNPHTPPPAKMDNPIDLDPFLLHLREKLKKHLPLKKKLKKHLSPKKWENLFK